LGVSGLSATHYNRKYRKIRAKLFAFTHMPEKYLIIPLPRLAIRLPGQPRPDDAVSGAAAPPPSYPPRYKFKITYFYVTDYFSID
jgi:hypothetical protein